MNIRYLWLASVVIPSMALAPVVVSAQSSGIHVAQAEGQKKEEPKGKGAPGKEAPKRPAAPPQRSAPPPQRPAAPAPAQRPAAPPPQRPAAPPPQRPSTPPAAQPRSVAPPSAPTRGRENRPETRRPETKQAPSRAGERPGTPPSSSARPETKQAPSRAGERPGTPPANAARPETKQAPSRAGERPSTPPANAARPETKQAPARAGERPGTPPTNAARPDTKQAPSRAGERPAGAPTTAQPNAAPGTPPVRGAAPNAPASATQSGANAPALTATPAPQPAQNRDAALGKSGKLDQVRQERHEVKRGNETIIQEPGRTIVRNGNRTIIRHNETDRFRFTGSNVRTERRGNDRVTIVSRPGGVQIVNVVDDDGRLIRRSRRENGRDIVIIDNSRVRDDRVFLDIEEPVVRIPRDRYIVDAGAVGAAVVYQTLIAPPVQPIERAYSLDEIRYNQPLRAYMPSVDLNTINFETGSWEVLPDQASRLAGIADGMNRAIEANPKTVFLIEGHTDAVGNDVDNLSLSDRRAESVATVLTEQFKVPPENLTTQGYGEQYPKVKTDGPSRENRRVTVRNITPLLDGQAQAR
jgi:outer membrane protein OmpA-like peptidoglycan-associated protein